MKVYPSREVRIAALIPDKAPILILMEYSDFKDVFSKKSAAVILEYTEINTYNINLKKDK